MKKCKLNKAAQNENCYINSSNGTVTIDYFNSLQENLTLSLLFSVTLKHKICLS